MTYYPIIIPTLNRYQHFKECVESLAACTHADKTEIVIGLDYPPSEKYVEGWKQIKNYLPTISGFRKVTIFEHDHNLGLGKNGNFSFLVDYVSKLNEAYIETEDDNVFSPCFLDYMNNCLERYKDDPSVMAICSYINRNEFYRNQYGNTVLKLQGAFNGWGVGFWTNKYTLYKKRIIPDYREKICNNKFEVIKAFNRPELFKNFIEWLEKNPSLNRPCDITYEITNLVLNKYVIYPKDYISKNMGFDGSGENCEIDINNVFSKRNMIQTKYYEIVDNFSKKLDKKNQRCYSRAQNKRITIKERIFYKVLILIYFCFGYSLTNKIKKSIHRFSVIF